MPSMHGDARIHSRVFIGGLLLLAMACSPGFSQGATPAKPDSAQATQSSDAQSSRAQSSKGRATLATRDEGSGDDPYRIGVGDVLHISVWEEPQFTETAVVRPDGHISMPLVSEVMISGLTPAAAEKVLRERLTKFVNRPRVTVTVQEIHSRVVYITGEVQRPGAYPLVDEMNVVQLIARSGGLTEFAKKKQVYVLHEGSGAKTKVDYSKVVQGQHLEENVQLTPGDTVVVP